VRCWDYADANEAVRDALRLSRGMTYKNALAGLDLGGGKSVILGGPRAKSPGALHAFARAIERLDGRYIGAEDVGMTVADIDYMRDVTPFVAGTSWGASASGDPSPYTAEGVFVSLKAAVEALHGSDDLEGCRVGVLGLGNVGWKLAEKLYAAGATLMVADVNPGRTDAAASSFDAQVFAPDRLPFAAMDVFAPCALSGALTMEWAQTAPAKIICGAANNQLAKPEVDAELWDAGKLYAPDYLVNAGGVMNVAAEASGEYDAYRVATQVASIRETAAACFAEAKRCEMPTGAVADALAMARINGVREAA
jgi:leucine dehydrogenase